MLNGTTLEISLSDDGQALQTVDLSGIDTDTDDQTIDALMLNGTTLEISLSDDGEANKILDLSSLNSVKSLIADADNNTKIQVEESANEDMIRFDVGGLEKMVITSDGRLGLGTNSPSAKLDINGTFKLGSNGSNLTNMIKANVSKNVGSISSDNHVDVNFSVPGAQTGSSVIVSPSANLPNQVIIGQTRVSSSGTVQVRFHNESNSSKDPVNMTYYITVIK
jgi:hypothetical protein